MNNQKKKEGNNFVTFCVYLKELYNRPRLLDEL